MGRVTGADLLAGDGVAGWRSDELFLRLPFVEEEPSQRRTRPTVTVTAAIAAAQPTRDQLRAARLACRYQFCRLMYTGAPAQAGLHERAKPVTDEPLGTTDALVEGLELLVNSAARVGEHPDFVVMGELTFAVWLAHVRRGTRQLTFVRGGSGRGTHPAIGHVPVLRSAVIGESLSRGDRSTLTASVYAGWLGPDGGLEARYPTGRGDHGLTVAARGVAAEGGAPCAVISWECALAWENHQPPRRLDLVLAEVAIPLPESTDSFGAA